MSFHLRSWAERMKVMGDEAEGVCAAVWPKPLAPCGLNRPPFDLRRLSNFTKKAPDFIDEDGYIECKGCGKDGIIKLKDTDMAVLYEYSEHDAVRLFVWDSHRRRYSWAELSAVTSAMAHDGDLAQFWDGPLYTALDVRDFPNAWTDYEHPALVCETCGRPS